MIGDSWERLSAFESRDLVSDLYLLRHRRVLSARKATEITSCLVQGRQFFEAAAIAGDLARPLLLYYGVLALTRGMILFLDPTMQLSTLKPSHGVEAKEWSNELLSFGDGAKRIPSLKLQLSSSGTFSHLVSITQNSERWRVFQKVYPNEFRGLAPGSTTVASIEVTVLEILERVPDLCSLFERTFPSNAQCHPAFIYIPDFHANTQIEVMESGRGLIGSQDLISVLQMPPATTTASRRISSIGSRFVRSQQSHHEDVQVRRVVVTHSSVDGLMPHLARVKNDRNGNIYLVAPFPDGTVLSSMSLLFLLSYVMGMLVRYYPSVWQALVGRQAGDVVFPLLRAGLALIRDQYPHFVINELEDVSPKFPRVI